MTRRPTAADRADVYTRITAELVAAIEKGTGSWRMPWHHNGSAITRPMNFRSQKRYRGVNVLALWAAAETHEYACGLWGTFKQWQAEGAQVRKGERGTTVVLWKTVGSANDNADADYSSRRLFARAFTVFNAAQVDGYAPEAPPVLDDAKRFENADSFFAALAIPLTHGEHHAHYRVDLDRIFMPPYGAFHDPAGYAGTLIHEAAHATGAKSRLDRDLRGRFGDASYAGEELVAELTASFVLADLGIACHPRPDHAAYLASWLKALKDDPRALFTAASKAQQAADWMHAQQAHGVECVDELDDDDVGSTPTAADARTAVPAPDPLAEAVLVL